MDPFDVKEQVSTITKKKEKRCSWKRRILFKCEKYEIWLCQRLQHGRVSWRIMLLEL